MSNLMFFFAAIHAALLVWSFSWNGQRSPRLWLLRIMLFGMIYDNLAQGSGQWFVGQSWYELANIPRYVIHAGALPFLTLFGLSVMRQSNVALASNTAVVTFCWLFTGACLAWGLYHEVFLLQLQPADDHGVIRLVGSSNLPPIGTILTNVLLIPMAALVWRASTSSCFFLGTLFIFLLNGSTGSQTWGFIAGNFGEVVFISCLLLTERRLIRVALADEFTH